MTYLDVWFRESKGGGYAQRCFGCVVQNPNAADSNAKAHGNCRKLQIPISPLLVPPTTGDPVAKVCSKDSQIEVHLHISYISYHRDMSKGIMMLEKKRKEE